MPVHAEDVSGRKDLLALVANTAFVSHCWEMVGWDGGSIWWILAIVWTGFVLAGLFFLWEQL